MYHSGIGGGGFALVRDSEGNYETIDYREAAPAAASENMYKGNLPGAVVGGLAVAVPGDLKGLEYLHTKHGVSSVRESIQVDRLANSDYQLLSWQAVVSPSVSLARNGFNGGSMWFPSANIMIGALTGKHSYRGLSEIHGLCNTWAERQLSCGRSSVGRGLRAQGKASPTWRYYYTETICQVRPSSSTGKDHSS